MKQTHDCFKLYRLGHIPKYKTEYITASHYTSEDTFNKA